MESDLIRRLKQNDQQALDSIYNMYGRQLVVYCHAYVKSPQDIEELVQDVFLALWNSRGKIRNTETLRPLLFKSMRNRIINFYRSRFNTPLFEDYISINEESVFDDSTPRIEYREFEQAVINHITSLPKTQRETIILSRIEGKTNEEIAEILHINVQSVKNALHIGLKKLKEILDKTNGISLISIYALFDTFSDII